MPRRPKVTKVQRHEALLIAMVIRNEIENFHVEHLTDAQMKELNPLIRNGVLTAIHALSNADNERALAYVNLQDALIPDYWEDPVLTEDYKRVWRRKEFHHFWLPSKLKRRR